MKGNEKILEILNERLKEELTAINQYFLHAEMCEDWGYERLHEVLEARAIQEMKHAEALIGRILFLEGMPIVSELGAVHIGTAVDKQLKNDWDAEKVAIDGYNESIQQAFELADNGTRELLESNLKDEEDHIDWIEEQMDLIEQMGLQHYLNKQVRS